MQVGSESRVELPMDQQRIRVKLSHPEGSYIPFPKESLETCISERFEHIVRVVPERLALKTRSHAYTYDQLNRTANRVAHALLELEPHGKAQGVVALLFENGAPFVVASLGALKAGKIQAPLESTFPRVRLSSMLEQSQATILVTDGSNLRLAGEIWSGSLIDLDSMADRLSVENPGLPLTSDACVAVEYTSGSTGQPKGIVRNHRGALHNVMQHNKVIQVSIKDRLFAPRVSLRAHLFALLSGAACYPVNMGEEESSALAEWLISEGVTVYRSAVSAFRSFASGLGGSEKFPDLRLVSLFGEPVYHTDVELYRRHFADRCVLVTSLGCNEFGDYAYFFVDHETPPSNSLLPGGYPIEGVEILLLDDDGQPLASDRIGEIAVRSRYGAAGYWRKPDLTQASFLACPGSRDELIYRTGDLGRRGTDGCLFHKGRKDFQVKILGYRVEVAEVETALLALESIKEAVVVARQDSVGNNRLVAYCVPSGQTPPTVSQLRRFLADKLPHYMTPSLFVMLDTLPLTATGKVDRRSLPPPAGIRPAIETPYIAPRTPLEEKLARIWEEVLVLDRVGVHDNFLELGGDSLLATMLVSRVLAQFQVRLPLQAMLRAPTVEKMSLAIVENQARNAFQKEEVDQMLLELEGLSEGDARSLLDKEIF